MKKFALILAAGFCCVHVPAGAGEPVTPARAAEPANPAKLAAATVLVEKLDLDRTVDNMFMSLRNVFAENAIAMMLRNDGDGNIKRFFASLPGGQDRFAQVLGDEFQAAMRRQYPEMEKVAAEQYASVFTADELGTLNSFFSTGVGQKWLAVSPKLQKIMSDWGRNAGMKAGAEAMAAAIKQIETKKSDTGDTK